MFSRTHAACNKARRIGERPSPYPLTWRRSAFYTPTQVIHQPPVYPTTTNGLHDRDLHDNSRVFVNSCASSASTLICGGSGLSAILSAFHLFTLEVVYQKYKRATRHSIARSQIETLASHWLTENTKREQLVRSIPRY